jgi:TPR repeat protein
VLLLLLLLLLLDDGTMEPEPGTAATVEAAGEEGDEGPVVTKGENDGGGNGEAEYQAGLGHYLREPQPDMAAALRCFEAAVKLGHAGALYSLALCRLTGEGSDHCGVDIGEEDSEGGCSGQALELGGCVRDDGDAAPPPSPPPQLQPQPRVAVQLLRQSAAKGHPAAQFELGLCLAEGVGVDEPDLHAAVRWYSAAAAGGHGMASAALAECYAEGRGVDTPDIGRARELRREAMRRGVAPAGALDYAECLATFSPDSAAAVGWLDGQGMQARRFRALLEVGVSDGCAQTPGPTARLSPGVCFGKPRWIRFAGRTVLLQARSARPWLRGRASAGVPRVGGGWPAAACGLHGRGLPRRGRRAGVCSPPRLPATLAGRRDLRRGLAGS